MLRQVRKLSGLTQVQVGLTFGMTADSSSSYMSRLEKGDIPKVALVTVARYLQACRVPIGRFMLELAQSGAFGEAEAEDVRGFTAQKPGGEVSNEQARRARGKLLYEKRWLREAHDADIIAKLWREVLPAIQPLLPADDPTRRLLAPYLEGVRALYRAWKLAVRGAVNKDPTPDVRMAFDRIEQAGLRVLVPAALRKMREIVFARLMALTPQGGNS
jgi:transcriptional regulator with XRE-family HTH domain